MKKQLGNFFVGCMGGLAAFGLVRWYDGDTTQKAILIERTVKEEVPYRLTASDETGIPVTGMIDFSHAAELTVNSVVHIRTLSDAQTTSAPHPFYEHYYRQRGPQSGSGSGVIISSDGYIVTNNHVIRNADRIHVTLNNNKAYTAHVIGADPGTDIALLKVEATGLPAITMGNSDGVKVGEWVLAVGNPFNLTSTVTAGIVSAKSRNINILEGSPEQNVFPIESFIQTDAAVNPGNSGGALVNSKGELIGINTAIASNTGSYSGYSFAVPVNLVQKVTSDLLRYGVVQRGFLGVNIRNLDQKLADEIGVEELSGVYVGGVVPGGAAELAGLKSGDIILRVGTAYVNTVAQLQEYVGRFRPGDVVNVHLRRGKNEMLVPVTLRNSEGNTGTVKKETVSLQTALGATFSKPTASELQKLGLKNGIKVSSVSQGKLLSAGITKGFIITKVDHEAVNDPESLVKLLKTKKGGVLLEGLYPNGSKGYYAFGL